MANLSRVEKIVRKELAEKLDKLIKYKYRGFGIRLAGVLEEKGIEVSKRNLHSYMSMDNYDRIVWTEMIKLLRIVKEEKKEEEDPEYLKKMLDAESKKKKEEAARILKELGV